MADANSPEVWRELAATSSKIRDAAATLHPAAELVRVLIGPAKGRLALAWVEVAGEEVQDAALRDAIAKLPRVEHVRDVHHHEARDGVTVTPVPDRRQGRAGENAFVMLDVTVRDLDG